MLGDIPGPRGVHDLRVSTNKALCVISVVGLGVLFTEEFKRASWKRPLVTCWLPAPPNNVHNIKSAISVLTLCEAAQLTLLWVCRSFKTEKWRIFSKNRAKTGTNQHSKMCLGRITSERSRKLFPRPTMVKKALQMQRWFPQTRIALLTLNLTLCHSLLFLVLFQGSGFEPNSKRTVRNSLQPMLQAMGQQLTPGPKEENVGGSRLRLIKASHDSLCAGFSSLRCQFYVFIVILELQPLSQAHTHIWCWGFQIALCLSEKAHCEWSGLFHFFPSLYPSRQAGL